MVGNYLNKIYAGFLGMNAGIRLGAPVEPGVWTSERIQRFYGDIHGYVKEFRNFAADDDANGPVYFLRALYDKASGKQEVTPQDVADAWLNYAREGIGMFWWGGYGVSTEHTVYLNLKNGVPAPQSGSIALNGRTLAEQIGGQIFIDTWGLVCPGDPAKAADCAAAAASVSHDGEGVFGARFIAAMIAEAFHTSDVDELIESGLRQIPTESTYARVVNAVRDFYEQEPSDWRACLRYLQEYWGYDRYPGVCHIIPNAGVCAMAMLYGRRHDRAIEIASMSGWDTDCNAGNVGTILGVAGGLEGVAEHYRAPIGDFIALSGISGYLNILDVPSYCKEVALLGYRMMGEEAPADLVQSVLPGELHFDFSLPGATHGLRLSNPSLCRLSYSKEESGCAAVLFDGMARGKHCKVYYKPFYRRADFDDERYMPVFSPTAYPGQTVTMRVRADRETGESVAVTPYVRDTSTGRDLLLGGIILKGPDWTDLRFTIPDLEGAMIDELGLVLEGNSPAKNPDNGRLLISRIDVTGKALYSIDPAKQKKEFASITPFSHNHGAWDLADGKMEAMCLTHCEAMTGNYYLRNARVSGSVTPHTGDSHLISIRVQGAQRGYYAGLCADGAILFRHEAGQILELAKCAFDWQPEQTYALTLTAQSDELTLEIDGEKLLCAHDAMLPYGMTGYAMYGGGRCGFGKLTVEEL